MRVESLAVHVVHGRAKVYGDEDGVRQVKEESGDKVRVGCSCGGSTKDLEGFVALYGRSDTRQHQMWQVYRFAPQNWMVVGLPVLASKSGASGAAKWWLRRARGVIVKLMSRRSEVVKAAYLSGASIKSCTILPLKGICVVCLIEDVLVIG